MHVLILKITCPCMRLMSSRLLLAQLKGFRDVRYWQARFLFVRLTVRIWILLTVYYLKKKIIATVSNTIKTNVGVMATGRYPSYPMALSRTATVMDSHVA